MYRKERPILIRSLMDPFRAGRTLRQLVTTAHEVASTTSDPTLKAVGYFYGSCMADGSGTPTGTAGSESRSDYCFGMTRRYLDRALLELLMERVWPAAARGEGRRFWSLMKTAGGERFRASKTINDSVKQTLATYVTEKTLDVNVAGDAARAVTPWQSDYPLPNGTRGPSSDIPFAQKATMATWVSGIMHVSRCRPQISERTWRS